ncbi:alpha/beta hydrolase fold protein [Gracilaria domingensis]|nr:alpha/beta hydrolase fold protein [Gracilaria domingensis]
MDEQVPKPPSYKLALCLAGAATGGAYSAGVMDFFLEAMNEWEALKKAKDPKVPPWDVRLKDIIGSSAGGITATLATASVNIPYNPLPRNYKLGDDSPENNPLFQVWVKEMNAEQLLSCNDLTPERDGSVRVRSFLNANFMSDTATKVIDARDVQAELPHWASKICLSITTTNMRGVPYVINTFRSVAASDAFYMRRHADYCQYVVTTTPEAVPDHLKNTMHILDITRKSSSDGWQSAITATKATAAFPVGFPTVQVKTPRSHYESRLNLPPSWSACREGKHDVENPDANQGDVFVYSAVDGGALNSEPFGLAEDFLKRRHNHETLETQPEDCWGSVVLIDPFPSTADDPNLTREQMSLLPIFRALMTTIRGQAMFKAEEIEKAFDNTCLSKFIIRPDRPVKKGEVYPLATETMKSFGGILDEKIRLHDFMLGRANCKKFLENVFCISREEALKHKFFNRYPEFLKQERIAIIPVVGKAAEPVPLPEWPAYSEWDRRSLERRVMKLFKFRSDKVTKIMFVNRGIIKPAGVFDICQRIRNLGPAFVRRQLQKRALDEIEDAVERALSVYK